MTNAHLIYPRTNNSLDINFRENRPVASPANSSAMEVLLEISESLNVAWRHGENLLRSFRVERHTVDSCNALVGIVAVHEVHKSVSKVGPVVACQGQVEEIILPLHP